MTVRRWIYTTYRESAGIGHRNLSDQHDMAQWLEMGAPIGLVDQRPHGGRLAMVARGLRYDELRCPAFPSEVVAVACQLRLECRRCLSVNDQGDATLTSIRLCVVQQYIPIGGHGSTGSVSPKGQTSHFDCCVRLRKLKHAQG